METKKINRSRQKIMLPETIALRKMRELLGHDRKTAGLLVEKSAKQLEKIENGFVEVTPQLITHFIEKYSFSWKNFDLLIQGKFVEVKKNLNPLKKLVVENNKLRRSYKKIITDDIRVLISLRKQRGLTQYNAGRICGYSKATIGHIENGRIEVPHSRIEHIVKSYGFTMKDFEGHKSSDVLITDLQDDCIKILKKIDNTKLNAVHSVLESFNK